MEQFVTFSEKTSWRDRERRVRYTPLEKQELVGKTGSDEGNNQFRPASAATKRSFGFRGTRRTNRRRERESHVGDSSEGELRERHFDASNYDYTTSFNRISKA